MGLCGYPTASGKPCRNVLREGALRCHWHAEAPTPEQVEKVVTLLRAGAYLEIAALGAGLSVEALSSVPSLRPTLERARAEGELRNVARIQAAAADNWQAAAFLLERQYPERWGRPAVRSEEKLPPPVTGPDALDELARQRQARRAAR